MLRRPAGKFFVSLSFIVRDVSSHTFITVVLFDFFRFFMIKEA